jgi:hypothetical protein
MPTTRSIFGWPKAVLSHDPALSARSSSETSVSAWKRFDPPGPSSKIGLTCPGCSSRWNIHQGQRSGPDRLLTFILRTDSMTLSLLRGGHADRRACPYQGAPILLCSCAFTWFPGNTTRRCRETGRRPARCGSHQSRSEQGLVHPGGWRCRRFVGGVSGDRRADRVPATISCASMSVPSTS